MPDRDSRARTRLNRRAQPVGEARTGYLLKLSEEERSALRAKAERLGVSVPRLLVESALADVMTRTQRAGLVGELDVANRLLANLTANVNQLAHHANAGGNVPSEELLADILGEIEVLRPQVETIIRQVR